ncbi:MAG: hypothetical protein JEZ04_15035 [Spirochaetales bacterium]|nr:hypothetical protein [Spirochaetales bacterium]
MNSIKWIILSVMAAVAVISCSSSGGAEVRAEIDGDYRLVIETGDSWLHEFDLFLWFKLDNPPQYAVWMEDLDGNYLETIAVTEKIAKGKWIANDGNRRVEALPYWSHRRGVVYSDGLMLPSGDNPLPDAVTTASAKTDSRLGFNPEIEGPVRIVAEFNHSMDYNTEYPEDAGTGGADSNVSGQPSVVFSAIVDLRELAPGSVQLNLSGHGSPDGSDGNLYSDLGSLTTALSIVDSVWIEGNL